MSKDISKGDKVQWKSHGSTVTGTVEEMITSDTKTAGRQVRADSENPQYRVRSDKSGRDAVHKPESLKKPESFKKK
jgi:Hypervirulence associated proteins TUDOR domain